MFNLTGKLLTSTMYQEPLLVWLAHTVFLVTEESAPSHFARLVEEQT